MLLLFQPAINRLGYTHDFKLIETGINVLNLSKDLWYTSKT